MLAPLIQRLVSIEAIPCLVLLLFLAVVVAINLRLRIIPDLANFSGAALGVILNAGVFALRGASLGDSLLFSISGIIVGFFNAWIVMELGKRLFGKKRYQWQSVPFFWHREGRDATLDVGDEECLWSDFFVRDSDRVEMECITLEIGEEFFENVSVMWTVDFLCLGDRRWELIKTDDVAGSLTSIVVPREALGFGVVKLAMAIGAFAGWAGALFVFWAAMLLVLVASGFQFLVSRRGSRTMEVSPYLLMGTVIWTLYSR